MSAISYIPPEWAEGGGCGRTNAVEEEEDDDDDNEAAEGIEVSGA